MRHKRLLDSFRKSVSKRISEGRISIAVATSMERPDWPIYHTAERAPYYMIFNSEGMVKGSVKNPFILGNDTGSGVSKLLAEKKVNIVVAGRFSPSMISDLDEKRIKLVEAKGLARQVVLKLIEEKQRRTKEVNSRGVFINKRF